MSLKSMDIAEFRELGFLQEANRLFFHPHGLALMIMRDAKGERLARIWDCRDDPEGVVYAGSYLPGLAAKAALVAKERAVHSATRAALFGSPDPDLGPVDIQPLDFVPEPAAEAPVRHERQDVP